MPFLELNRDNSYNSRDQWAYLFMVVDALMTTDEKHPKTDQQLADYILSKYKVESFDKRTVGEYRKILENNFGFYLERKKRIGTYLNKEDTFDYLLNDEELSTLALLVGLNSNIDKSEKNVFYECISHISVNGKEKLKDTLSLLKDIAVSSEDENCYIERVIRMVLNAIKNEQLIKLTSNYEGVDILKPKYIFSKNGFIYLLGLHVTFENGFQLYGKRIYNISRLGKCEVLSHKESVKYSDIFKKIESHMEDHEKKVFGKSYWKEISNASPIVKTYSNSKTTLGGLAEGRFAVMLKNKNDIKRLAEDIHYRYGNNVRYQIYEQTISYSRKFPLWDCAVISITTTIEELVNLAFEYADELRLISPDIAIEELRKRIESMKKYYL